MSTQNRITVEGKRYAIIVGGEHYAYANNYAEAETILYNARQERNDLQRREREGLRERLIELLTGYEEFYRVKDSNKANACKNALMMLKKGAMFVPVQKDNGWSVLSSDGVTRYHVIKQSDGKWRCSCQAHKFCKHIALAGAMEKAVAE